MVDDLMSDENIRIRAINVNAITTTISGGNVTIAFDYARRDRDCCWYLPCCYKPTTNEHFQIVGDARNGDFRFMLKIITEHPERRRYMNNDLSGRHLQLD